MSKLAGKVAIVTGASSGIGEATAIALAAEGAKVAIAARQADRLQSLTQQIAAIGGQSISVMADVANEAHTHKIVRKTSAEWGHIDILVNNADVMLPGSSVGADPQDWRRTINTNLLGLMYATHAALPAIKAQGGGHIVNIVNTSTAGRPANANAAVYMATEAGIRAFSEALRRDVYPDKIRVTVIEPNAVAMELDEHLKSGTKRTQAWLQAIKQLEKNRATAVVQAVTQPLYLKTNAYN